MELIDKQKVVEEIERIKKEECHTDTYEGRCKLFWFEQFSSFLDTLETKEVDLEVEDAFIEKAIGWIDYNNRNGGCFFDGWEKDFKKYIKEE